MYSLKKLNVIKVVDSEHKANRLIYEGFTLISQPVFESAVTPTPKPSIVVEVETTKEPSTFDCPYCDKTYKGEKSLMKHIEDKHSVE